MSVKSVCRTNVVTISPKASVLMAAQVMKQEHMGSLVVAEATNGARKPLGILTDRDIVRLIVANEADARSLQVEDVMTRDVQCLQEDEGIYKAMKKMRQLGLRRMPVVRKDGSLLGIVSLDDFMELLADELNQISGVSATQRKKEEGRTIWAELD